jgi:hypothetical protein
MKKQEYRTWYRVVIILLILGGVMTLFFMLSCGMDDRFIECLQDVFLIFFTPPLTVWLISYLVFRDKRFVQAD